MWEDTYWGCRVCDYSNLNFFTSLFNPNSTRLSEKCSKERDEFFRDWEQTSDWLYLCPRCLRLPNLYHFDGNFNSLSIATIRNTILQRYRYWEWKFRFRMSTLFTTANWQGMGLMLFISYASTCSLPHRVFYLKTVGTWLNLSVCL